MMGIDGDRVYTDRGRPDPGRPAADEHVTARAVAAASPDGHRRVLHAQQHGNPSGKHIGHLILLFFPPSQLNLPEISKILPVYT